jgi:3-oxoadipate enol-lactonase
VLRGFWQREGELIDAGDIAGAAGLNVAAWLGPEASQATRDRARLMQWHTLEVQLAAPQEYEPAEVAVDLGAITAARLVVSGAKDLPDFGLIAASLAALLPGTRQVELAWAGHLPALEGPQELSGILSAFLREIVPAG